MKRKTRYITMGALFVFWLVFMGLMTRPAHAQIVCTEDRKDAVARLASKYQEAPVSIGLAANGSIIEVFATRDGKTFTISLTTPEGMMCMMAAGENWESIPFKLSEDDAI